MMYVWGGAGAGGGEPGGMPSQQLWVSGNQGDAPLQSSELTHLLPASPPASQVVSRGWEAVALAISWGRGGCQAGMERLLLSLGC